MVGWSITGLIHRAGDVGGLRGYGQTAGELADLGRPGTAAAADEPDPFGDP